MKSGLRHLRAVLTLVAIAGCGAVVRGGDRGGIGHRREPAEGCARGGAEAGAEEVASGRAHSSPRLSRSTVRATARAVRAM